MKDMGSPQIGQSGGGPWSMRGRMGSSMSSSFIAQPLKLAVSLTCNRFLGMRFTEFVFASAVGYPSRGRILSCKAFSALSRLGTPTNVSRPSMIVAGTARTACRLASSWPSGVVISTSR